MGDNFNDNLRNARLKKGYSQKEVAENIGVAKSTYSLYESGNREPNVQTIKKLADLLSVSTDDLLGIEDETDTDISIDETFEKICKFYNILNPEGKAEALKRISELSQILQYSANHKAVAIPMAIPFDTLVAAARNDHADDPDETEKMQTDMNLLKRPEKKDDVN